MFLVFATCGCIESVCSGLIIDDATEQKTFRTITAAAYSLLHGDIAGFNQLASYDQRYYGIGFYLIAYPLQAAIRPVLAGHFQIDNETALLLARRPVCFLLFAIATVIFYRCLRFQIRDKLVCAVFTAAFAMYPYVFGHAMINIKDSPFMSVYLICTYLSLRLVKTQLKGVSLLGGQIAGLGIATAALASIRIPGVMIILQYGFTFFLTDLGKGRTTPRIVRPSNVLLFCVLMFPLVVLAYPALWRNPVQELFNAMKFMVSRLLL